MAKTKQTKLTGNAKDAVECLRGLRRKTDDAKKRNHLSKTIKDIKKCYK